MRKFLLKLHKWLSLPVGIIITITCLTGAIQVFQQEILEIVNPSHYFVKEAKTVPIPLHELIPIVNAQLDTNTVAAVKIYSDPARTYTMTLAKGFRISAFVDQYTGEVTGIQEYRKTPFFKVMSLHRWLMDGSRTWGKYTVGISTIFFALILISGFIVWMPRLKNKSRFKIQYKKGTKRLIYDLHNVLGAYACLVLLICAMTGLMWSFDWYKNTVFRIFGAEIPKERSKTEKKSDIENELNIMCWQNVFDNLKANNHQSEYIQIQDRTVNIHQTTAATSRAADKYNFDPQTGEITKTILFKDQDQSVKIWAWVYTLHTGNYWGIYSKIITFILALVGASLPLTGYYLFFYRKIKKNKRT